MLEIKIGLSLKSPVSADGITAEKAYQVVSTLPQEFTDDDGLPFYIYNDNQELMLCYSKGGSKSNIGENDWLPY